VFQEVGSYSPFDIKTLFMQEMLARGVLTLGTHNMSYSHSEGDVQKVLAVYDEVLPIIASAVAQRDLVQRLRCEPLKPLYRLR
jgi:glutamate-1-semialdehyde 2,1-aminomutase